ncbi:ATP-dependent DNA helicase [Dactylonectria macrodidyma]|uniref:DNA 3'-5' helicase n=1 Tax=Dactylonectria macrodidyma TaxID=307937 RepID=A0A9P9CXY5_9HYPO|nr:ATP-dependent DNA helicase [Dactylonectria macrodidyma]
MRNRASIRRRRRDTTISARNLVHDADNTTSMLAIQDLVDMARHASEEVQKGIIRAGLQRHLYPFEPRPKQVDATWHLVFKKEDLLLAAKTSFGKSVIFQAAPLFCRDGIGLIIIPLDRIGQEQCIKIQRLPGARSVFINGRTDKTDALAQEIETGVYTHLIMGPEIAAGWFRSIASSPTFKKRVCIVAVDELHLVALWGSGIRPQYAQLSLLRRRLGGGVPWFGCSATLDRTTLDTATKMTGFQASCEFFRSSVDRPEIKLIVEMIQPRKTKRFTSLFFILHDAITNGSPTPESIPKTVIFIDSRRDIQKCAECLREWLQKLSAGAIGARDCKQIIQVYHSHTTLNDKNAIYDEFSKADSKIRIMVATESLGTGVDLSDVIRVVQYGFPLERLLCVLIQRFGRAARMTGIKGEAIFLVESWAVGDRIASTRAAMFSSSQTPSSLRRLSATTGLAQSCSAEPVVGGDIPDYESDVAVDVIDCDVPGEQRRRKTDRERRTDLYNDCPALFNLVNRSSCLRRILMDWLQESLSDPASKLPAPGPDECCSVCNPSLTRTVPFPWEIAPGLRKPNDGTASGAFYDRLVLWGDNAVNSAHQMAKPKLSVRLFTQESEWISLSTEYAYIHTAAELEEFVESTWLKDHFGELYKEFNDIKSYVVRNWPGGSRPRTSRTSRTSGAVGPVHISLNIKNSTGVEMGESQERRASNEVGIPRTPDQGRRTSFLREREEFASSLQRIIANARESSAPCSPHLSTPPMAPVPANSSSTSISGLMTSTNANCSAAISSVFEDSENEVPGVVDGNRLSKRPTSSRGEGEMAKRVALGVLDPNARRSPRNQKGKNSRYDHREWIL